MGKVIKISMWMLLMCLLMGNVYGADKAAAITESTFYNRLQLLGKGRSVSVQDQPLTRGRAADLIVSYLGYEELAPIGSGNFTDVDEYENAIGLICEWGILKGTGDKTFSPSQIVTSEVSDIIFQRLQARIGSETNLWKHACYAIQSSGQMDLIPNFDAISFGWATLEIDVAGEVFDLSTDHKTSDFKVPSGFQGPVDLATANGVETYLMVYMDSTNSGIQAFLTNEIRRKELIMALVKLVEGVEKEGVTRSFDGLTIDFEQLKSKDLQNPYVTFLKELKTELIKINKKLNVAVQPTLYFQGYDYKGIGEVADHVILMAHDYAAKRLSVQEQQLGVCMTPVTPIQDVYSCLNKAITSIQEKEKIVLQISFDSRQWQLEGQVVNHSVAYTPSYDKIASRLQAETTARYYDSKAQNPYAVYISEGIKNVIWYEDSRSIEAKTGLAQLIGIGGISYWRLGSLYIL